MQYTFFIYRPGEEAEHMIINFPTKPNYGQIRDVVEDIIGEDEFDETRVIHEGVERRMFVISDANNTGREINAKASDIYNETMKADGINQKGVEAICGPVVIVAPPL